MDNETLDHIEKKEETGYSDKRFRPLYVIFPFLFLASAFKILHWPGQVFFLLISLTLVGAHALTMLLFLKKNEPFTNIGAAAAVGGIIYYVSNEFNSNGWILAAALGLAAVVGFYFWVRE